MFTILTWGGLFLTPSVQLTGLILVFAWRPFSLVFGIKLTSLPEDPTAPVGVVCRLIGCAMNLTGPIQYLV